MATVYRFRTWNSHNDTLRVSDRWATNEAIEGVTRMASPAIDPSETWSGSSGRFFNHARS